jgi:hypothetical protein
MTKRIFVAHTTRLVSETMTVPEFDPPANYKDPVKIAEWQANKKLAFLANAKDQPYTGTFDVVTIAVADVLKPGTPPSVQPPFRWSYMLPDKNDKKKLVPRSELGLPPICLAIRDWLLTEFPTAWDHSVSLFRRKEPEAVFVGFNIRRFVKMLGIECTLPRNRANPTDNNALPLSMWYGNADYRDMNEAIMPGVDTPLSTVLEARGIEAASWEGPGTDADREIMITTELASQLGMWCETSAPDVEPEVPAAAKAK